MGDDLLNVRGELKIIKKKKQEKNIMLFGNLHKIFPGPCEIFKDEKHSYEDEDNAKTKIELSIPNI